MLMVSSPSDKQNAEERHLQRLRRGRKRNRPLPITCFANSKSPPLQVDSNTWKTEMTDIDRILYTQFKRYHPKPFSPEALLDILQRRYRRPETQIQDVWRSLDGPVMMRYIFRKNLNFWFLITEAQKQEYEAQFVTRCLANGSVPAC